MKEIRIFFRKCGRAKYISHLDLMRTMTRAVRRAGIPVWYTQGFNKHPYITFAAPLSLGFEGLTESMDIKLIQDIGMEDIVADMNSVLPSGIEVYSAAEPVMKAGDIEKAIYKLTFSIRLKDFAAFIEQDSITAEKRTKKGGLRLIELKPFIEQANISENEDGSAVMEVTLPCGSTQTINPLLIVSVCNKFFADKGLQSHIFCDVLRLDLLDGQGNSFK
ncbi:MAG: TIGR03936 family radical SAM-associated protein [Oscillospiraceae bacterium]|nr:TIGR03936 family radical SAM-associated protein [Oscillospiraceae bacterium]MDD4413430.1 TIGR03936 family radical SAM-associated protein [Oscillospiraceae bacterium]